MAISEIVAGVDTGSTAAVKINAAVAQLNGWSLAATLADAVTAAATLSDGDIIQTLEYVSGSGIGSNTYKVMDNGVSRPTADGGHIIHVGASFKYLKGLFVHKVSVGQFGAAGDGTTDDSTAFTNTVRYVSSLYKSLPENSNFTITNGITLESPVEYYRIATPRAMIDEYVVTGQRKVGLTFKGESRGTQVHFDYDGDDYLMYINDEYLVMTFESIRFTCNSLLSKLLYSASDGGTQDYTWRDVTVDGIWQKHFVLRAATTGNGNTNSEWKFFGGSYDGSQDVMMDLEDSDQFLNYWWFGVKMNLTEGQCIRASKGGHFKFFGCDWSGLTPTMANNTSTNGAPLFEFTGRTHARGVCQLLIEGGRFEHKNDLSWLIYCEWNQGNININADFTSNLYTTATTLHAHFDSGNVGGPTVNFSGSQLQGTHRYENESSGWQYPKTATYDDCFIYGFDDANDFIDLVQTSGSNTGGVWSVSILESCRVDTLGALGSGENLVTATQVGGSLSRSSNVRTFKTAFRSTAGFGTPTTTNEYTLMMPENAIITNIQFVSDGSLTSTASVDFTVKDDAAVTIASAGSRQLTTAWNISTDTWYPLGSANRILHLTDANTNADQRSNLVCVYITYVGA